MIDINPGIGLWSRKLHQILRPRRHVLVETALQRYEKDLRPLLNRSQSAYRHANNVEEAFNPEIGLLSEYATEKVASGGDVPQFNNSLLITVNLSGRKVVAGSYLGSLGNKFFDDLYYVLFSRPHRSLFRYGLVRILAWMPQEKGKDPFLPPSASRRARSSITLEAMANVEEIAGPPRESGPTKIRRWSSLDIEESAAVDARADGSSQYRVPDSRRDLPLIPELLSINPTTQDFRKVEFKSDATWVSDFLKLEDRLKKEDPKFYHQHAGGLHHSTRNKTPLQTEWVVQMRQARTKYKCHMRAVGDVNETRRLIADWKDAVLSADGRPLTDAINRELRDRGDNITTRLKATNSTDRMFAEKAIDDCRAVDMSPPILLRSRRKGHSMVVHEGEIEPQNRYMALFDVVPHAGLLTKINNHDKMVCYRHVMATCSGRYTKSVVEVLKLLVHDAGVEDFLKTIPELYDPTKGGWYDLTQLRLRALPSDMFVEIALAYERWPFRPSSESILMAANDTQDTFNVADGMLH